MSEKMRFGCSGTTLKSCCLSIFVSSAFLVGAVTALSNEETTTATTTTTTTIRNSNKNHNIRGSSSSSSTPSVEKQQNEQHNEQRHLIPVSAFNKDMWPECTFAGDPYTPEECLEWITRDVENHTIENIQVKIASPRSPEQLSESSYKVGIFTNYLGDVIGRFHNGMVDYNFLWEGSGPDGTRDVGPWDCSGMDAVECCYNVILADVTDSNVEGNYMQCFVSEKGVEVDPHPNGSDTDVAYYTWIYNATSEVHERTEITLQDMHDEELVTQALLEPTRATMEGMVLQGYAIVDEVDEVMKDLQKSARAYELGPVQNLASNIDPLIRNAIVANEPTMDTTNGSDLETIFTEIEFLITKYEAESIHPGGYIIIRTNSNGEISHIPELEMDYRLPPEGTTASDEPIVDNTLPLAPDEPTVGPDGGGGADYGYEAPPCDPETDPFCSGPGGTQYYAGGDFGPNGPGHVPKYCKKKIGDVSSPGTCDVSKTCVGDWDCLTSQVCNYECSAQASVGGDSTLTGAGGGGPGGLGPGGSGPGGLGPP